MNARLMEIDIYARLTSQHSDSFNKIVGGSFVFLVEESLYHYSHDETETLSYLPEIVIKRRTAEEISAIMKICNGNKIPVTPLVQVLV